jgi:glycine hydroxymethyltransferase
LTQRYGDYQGRDPSARKYQGTRYIREIEALTAQLVQEAYRTKYVELRAVSGHNSDLAVILGLTVPGTHLFEVASEPGGHGDGRKLCENPLINAKTAFLPFDAKEYTVDLSKTIQMMRELRPSLIKLGTSSFLFPHPVSEIREEAEHLGNMYVAYDASHVFGLIAGGRFQDPLSEGAHVVMGSTHKTLPGPQGGLILTNDSVVAQKVSAVVYPILTSNHHLTRMPALSIALLEMLAFGKEYASQIIANAKTLGEEIHKRGIPVVAAHKGFTESHTILLQTNGLGEHHVLADRLDDAGIIVNASRLPLELGGQGLRIGLQEITRRGAREGDMHAIAEFIEQVIKKNKTPLDVAKKVTEYTHGFQGMAFTFNVEDFPE